MTKNEHDMILESARKAYSSVIKTMHDGDTIEGRLTKDEAAAYRSGAVVAIRTILSALNGLPKNRISISEVEDMFDSIDFPERFEDNQ